MQPAKVYDSNAQVLADAVRELGGEPRRLGIVADDVGRAAGSGCATRSTFADVVLLSGGTSKGAGDVSYRVVAELDDPGIVAHGVALKPGKPICLAATGGRAVVVLPGFPTSAIFTFHEFVAPVIRLLAGRGAEERTVGAGAAGGEGQQRDRPHRVPAGRPGRDGGRRRADRRSRRIRWGRGPAASRRSAAPTALRRSAGTRRSSRRARSSTCSCSAATCSWPTSS